MAKLSRDDVLKLAKLSGLELSEEEIKAFITEIESILTYVEQLQAVDLSAYRPTNQVTGLKNVERADEPRDYGINRDKLMMNLPDSEDGYIKVRRVLD